MPSVVVRRWQIMMDFHALQCTMEDLCIINIRYIMRMLCIRKYVLFVLYICIPNTKLTCDKSFAIEISAASRWLTRNSKLFSHKLRHCVKSGVSGCHITYPDNESYVDDTSSSLANCPVADGRWCNAFMLPVYTQRHLAMPLAPPGHGWTFTSPTRVTFQNRSRAFVGPQK